MAKIFLGKISSKYPTQFTDNFYAGGKPESSWYGGLKVGDYVFPIYNSSVSKLWKVKEFSNDNNSINPDGSVKFTVVKEYQNPISIASSFARYKYFELDLNLLNKLSKSTAKEKIGFYEIHCAPNYPNAEQMDFSELRSIYLAIENPFKSPNYKEGDIRILIDNKDNFNIKDIQILKDNSWDSYDLLFNLYKEKNQADQRYSLKQLLDFARTDQANNKEKFLLAAMDEIAKSGFFLITNPVSLYDNLLVGRKRTAKREDDGSSNESLNEEDPELTKEELDDYKEFVDLLKFSPNLILYGPPGTGKTFSAQKIIEAFEFDRTENTTSYKQIQNEGRVTFVTFHQSFSYEEFVEGLRPVITEINDESQNQESENLKYKVQPGILLNIANNAARSQITTDFRRNEFDKVKDTSRIWKISLGERGKDEWVFESCIKDNSIAIGWFDDTDIGKWDYDKIYNELSKELEAGEPKPTNNANSINNFVTEAQEGDLVLVFASRTSIRAIGMIDGPYQWRKEYVGKYPHRRRVKWLKKFETPIDIRKYNAGKNLSQVTMYELSSIKFLDIKELIEIEKPEQNKELKNSAPYFLIIDEINRGNISKIFGELITLVEKDKRDRIKVKLPYSQKEFSLPSNLYIIGTMNTADRSIAILDTALRRRFNFKELEPRADIVRAQNQFIEDLDLSVLIEKLNARIADKLDRDHRLGHSYFLSAFRIADLKITWYYQIIPLLMEYFYNDAESIASIISDAFIDKKTSQVIVIESDEGFKQALLNIK